MRHIYDQKHGHQKNGKKHEQLEYAAKFIDRVFFPLVLQLLKFDRGYHLVNKVFVKQGVIILVDGLLEHLKHLVRFARRNLLNLIVYVYSPQRAVISVCLNVERAVHITVAFANHLKHIAALLIDRGERGFGFDKIKQIISHAFGD